MPGISRAVELREERVRLSSRQQEILEAPAGEDGLLSSEQTEEMDRIHERQERLKAEIDRIEEWEADQRAIAQAPRPVQAGRGDMRGDEGNEPAEPEEPSAAERRQAVSAAFDAYLRRGITNLPPEERSLIEQRFVHNEQRAQGTNVDSAGGYLVPEEFMAQIIEARQFFGGMRQARSTIIATSSGNNVLIPTDDDTANTGALVGENAPQTEQDVTFGQVMLNSYIYSSKIVRVSRNLLQDSEFPLAPFLSRKFGQRIGRITNTHFTTGDGASKPEGVVEGATLGKTGAAGQTTSIISDDLFDLEHAVDRDYRQNAEWMMSDTMLRELKKLKDGEGRPLWVPGLQVGGPDRLLGYPYIVNNDVAVPAASAKSLLFGDFSLYYIRDAGGITVLRLDERYAENLQVAFLAFSRHDGKLIDAGTNPIQFYQHPAA